MHYVHAHTDRMVMFLQALYGAALAALCMSAAAQPQFGGEGGLLGGLLRGAATADTGGLPGRIPLPVSRPMDSLRNPVGFCPSA